MTSVTFRVTKGQGRGIGPSCFDAIPTPSYDETYAIKNRAFPVVCEERAVSPVWYRPLRTGCQSSGSRREC